MTDAMRTGEKLYLVLARLEPEPGRLTVEGKFETTDGMMAPVETPFQPSSLEIR